MATFRAGQRVRKVKQSIYARKSRVPNGTEGVIEDVGSFPMIDGPNVPYKVHYPGYISKTFFGAFDYQLEPLYDGNTKVSWDDCAWKPETNHVHP